MSPNRNTSFSISSFIFSYKCYLSLVSSSNLNVTTQFESAVFLKFFSDLRKTIHYLWYCPLSVCMITSVAGVHLAIRPSWIVFVEVIDDITVSLTAAAVSTSQPIALTHWGRDKIDAVLQTTFSNAISWMKMLEFWLKFHWSLFLKVQLTIFQHWFR